MWVPQHGVHFASQLRYPPVMNYVRRFESHELSLTHWLVYFVRGHAPGLHITRPEGL